MMNTVDYIAALFATKNESIDWHKAKADLTRKIRIGFVKRELGISEAEFSKLGKEEQDKLIFQGVALNDAREKRRQAQEYALMHGEKSASELAYEYFLDTVPERYKNAQLSDFNSNSPVINHILEGGSCLLSGTTGSGKTHMLWALGKELAKKNKLGDVVVMTLSELISSVRSNSSATDWILYATEKFGEAPRILFVDEYDKCKSSPSDYELFNHIIGKRYDNKLQTVLVGNGDITTARNTLGDAVISRLTGKTDNGAYYWVNAKDRRQA